MLNATEHANEDIRLTSAGAENAYILASNTNTSTVDLRRCGECGFDIGQHSEKDG